MPGVEYFYQLKTIRAHYNYSTEFSQPVSAETDEDFFLTLGTPAVTAAKGNFSRQAVLSWKKIEGASSYTVFAGDSLNSLSRLGKASEGAKHTQISDDGTVSYTAYVPNEQTYYFCVQASGNTGAYSQLSQTVAYDGIKAANTSQTAADPLYFNESQIFCFTAADKPLWFIIENSLPLSGKAELYVECIDTAEPLTVTLFKKNAPDITSSAASSFTLVSTQNIFGSASCELTFSDTNTAETVSYYICIALRNKTALYYDYAVTLREAE